MRTVTDVTLRRLRALEWPMFAQRLESDDADAYEAALARLEQSTEGGLPSSVSKVLAARLERDRGWLRERTLIAIASLGADPCTLPAVLKLLRKGTAAERGYRQGGTGPRSRSDQVYSEGSERSG
jgi:hypothetical protein